MAQQYPYSAAPQSIPNSTMSIVSLITGILGLTFIPFVGSIIALITGYMAKKEIRESGGAMGGDGLATAGLVLGWIGVGLTVIGGCIVGIFFLVPFCLALFSISASGFESWLPTLLSLI